MTIQSIRLAAIGAAIAAVGCAGCAPGLVRGSVLEKQGGDEARVSLGDRELKIGDRVVLFKLVCDRPFSGKASAPGCRQELLGGGLVTRVLDKSASLVKVDAGVEFQEGTIVELPTKDNGVGTGRILSTGR